MNSGDVTRPGERRATLGGSLLLTGVVLALLLLWPGATGAQAECAVPSASYATIQAAVDDTGCDTIVVAAGTYAEEISIGRSLTIQGAGEDATIIDGEGNGRPITIDGADDETGPVVVRIEDVRVTNGNATSAALPARFGGGILVTGGATLHGEDLQIDNNVASTAAQTGFGGGLAVVGASAHLTRTTILSNTASVRATGTGQGSGGGLYAAGLTGSGRAVLSLYNSEVRGNVANNTPGGGNLASGGGLRVGDSDDTRITLTNTIWEANQARGENAGPASNNTGGVGDGGAIAISPTIRDAQVTITNSTFRGNIANASDDVLDGGANARGGAILVDNSSGGTNIATNVVTLTNVTMTENIAKAGSGQGDGQGGALYVRNNATIVYNTGVISGNIAAQNGSDRGQGGGIRLSGVGSETTLEATNLTILDNTALVGASGPFPGNDSQGGGIHLGGEGASLALVNSIVADNDAATTGGSGDGVYIDGDATADISHVTVAAETLNTGQGIYAGPTGDPNDVVITNTIVTSHTTGVHNQGSNGRVVESYMLFFGNTNNTIGSVVGNTGNVEGDPAFVDPAGRDYHIRAGSAAIDVGTNAGVNTDIDGDPRPSGAGFDIGADEYVPAVSVTGVTINGPASGPPGEYTFTAEVTPENASGPISYLWDNGDITSSSTRNLGPGSYTIAVTVTNNNGAGQATDTLAVTISDVPSDCAVPLTDVTVSGPDSGQTSATYTFTASPVPSNATPPITYFWFPEPDSGQGTASASYTWTTPGTKSVAVNAQNCGGSAADVQSISISSAGPGPAPSGDVYLPLIVR